MEKQHVDVDVPKPIYNVYSIYDDAMEAFGVPFFDVNDKCALRRIKAAYKGNPMIEGLSLYHVGLFDTGKGMFDCIKDPVFIVLISDLFEVRDE